MHTHTTDSHRSKDSNSNSSSGPALKLAKVDSKEVGERAIWSLTFDLPGEKVNKLSAKVMDEFQHLLDQLESMGREKTIDALILFSGKPGNFIAGADIDMIQATQNAQEAEALSHRGQTILNRWEDLPFPTIAAIEGAALGGGCELSLASSAIVMSSDSSTRIGLPEVMLGLVPGLGGCVRLPRKVGLATALEMILQSKNLNADRAVKAGLAEAALPKENFREAALRWTISKLEALQAHENLAKAPKLGGMGGPIGSLLENTPLKKVIFKKALKGVMSMTKGNYPAPLRALKVIESTGGSFAGKILGSAREKAMAVEAKAFGELAASEVSKNLIRLFFMTEGVKKSKGVESTSDLPKYVSPKNTAVLGAGIMGGGIAQLFAEKEIPIRMKDLNSQALALGIQAASKIFKKQVQKKKINQREFFQKMNHISPVVDYTAFSGVEVVIEAIIENLEIKKKVLAEVEQHVKPNCVIASNTSSLSITAMQKAFQHSERFCGMHFFNPVHKMPLVEVIRGEKTADSAISTIFQLSKQLGKIPIVVKDRPGFLVNRLLMPYLNEAVYLVADGVPVPEVDRVLLKFGMPMGPLELIDEVGIDVGEKVSHILHEAFGDRMAPASLNSKVVAAGHLGKKNGKGIYAYEGSKMSKSFDPAIYEIMGVSPSEGTISDEEILERCVLPMINEASRCLDEKVVSRASEVDLGMIMGTGFPAFRGGLLRYADSLGPKLILERLKNYHSRLGARFEPAPAMIRRAEHDEKFYPET